MALVFGRLATESGIDIYSKTYEDNRWDRSEVLTPSLSLETILKLQSATMKILQAQDRSVVRGERRHMFAALNGYHSEQDEAYDGSHEEYLVCRVQKVDFDQWKMRIRFRQNSLTHEEKKISYIDDYSFDWLRNGNSQAWNGTYKLEASDTGTREQWQDIVPITEEAAAELQDRIDEHMFYVIAAGAMRARRRA